MKAVIALLLAVFAVGCASKSDTRDWLEGAATCNEICVKNPDIREFSGKAGGGITLLFIGGAEVKCVCNRSGNSQQ